MNNSPFSGKKLFGDVAVAKGYVSSDQIMEALYLQISEGTSGKAHRHIGEILCSMGLLTIEQVCEIVSELVTFELSKEIIDRADCCQYGYLCMTLGKDHICPAKRSVKGKALLLQVRKRADCPYSRCLEKGYLCICPARVALFEMHSI